MLIKLGESVSVTKESIRNVEDDPEINSMFTDFVAELRATAAVDKTGKAIAPKAKDFLYFTAIMMHAAEAALLDDKGNHRKGSDGKLITASWEPVGKDSVGVCSDKNIKALENNNGDIFPAHELKKAYKKWVGKPLCLDHQSSSVDMVRGLIVDTYYDEARHRVIALCALDKISYPELARKVSTGVSASVSMGTAVGRAVCYDCHRSAKTEADFCEHMKSKSCYGEVNLDLSPIELSIVVNGADPSAKIRLVIAAADNIAAYIDQKEKSIKTASSEDAKELINKIENMVSELKASLGKDKEDCDEDNDSVAPYGQQGRGTQAMLETEVSNVNGNNPGGFTDRYAAEQITDILSTLNEKVAQLTGFINKLENSAYSNINKEAKEIAENLKGNDMTSKKAYFQGGGGVNEPTPGQVKYEKEDSDSIRDKEDKQMLGQSPFPDVGPVDGMHPGVESAPEGELARKKKLLRAEENNARKIRREAAVRAAQEAIESKKAYFNGGGGVNEPTPGKPKYEKEDSDSIRDDEDKQQVGAPPFPQVGKVDGLYGKDLETKKKVLRAKLNAQFVKSTDNNKGKDSWNVYHGDTLIMTASVNDLVGPTKVAAFYDSIATRDYGKKIIETIRTQGFETAVSIFKGAQTAVAGPAAAPAAAPDAAAAPVPPMPEMGDLGGAPVDGAPSDTGEGGDPVATIQSSLDEVDGLVADMKRQIETLKEEDTSDLEGAVGGAVPPATASVSLPNMRLTLHDALIKGAQQALSELEDHKEELQLLNHVYTNGNKSENAEIVNDLAGEAIGDVNVTVANVKKLMSAFVKYARGTEALVKRANEDINMAEDKCEKCVCKCDKCKGCTAVKDAKDEKKPEAKEDEADASDSSLDVGSGTLEAYLNELSSDGPGDDLGGELLDAPPGEDTLDLKVDKDGGMEGTGQEIAEALKGKGTAGNLSALRAKIAQKGVAFSDMLQKAHPAGGVTTKLDTKPTGDLAKVETLTETNKAMMELAEAAPKVRKEAEQIQRLVVAGKIDPATDFPALIAQGLDPAAAAYWKKFWGEAKDAESSKFVSDLVKDVANKKAEQEQGQYRVKVARSYELAHEMAARGMINQTRDSISKEASKLMGFSDENFAHLKEMVGHTTVKTASALPNAILENMMGSESVSVPAVQTSTEDLTKQFAAAFGNKRY